MIPNYGDYGVSKPIYSATGVITGYTNTVNQPPKGKTLIPGTNIPVSFSDQIAMQTQVNDPLGLHTFNSITGLNSQGRTRGQQAAFDLQQNTAPVSTVKSQPIATAEANTLKQTQDISGKAADQSNQILKTFDDYLNQAKQLQQTGAAQVNQDTATLNALPKKLDTELSDAVKNYASTTTGIDQGVAALNAEQAKTNQADIDAANANVDAYTKATRDIANQAVAAGQARLNAAQSASGTPRSTSGVGAQLAAQNVENVMLPAERDIAQMRTANLTNYITPLQQSQYAQQLSRLTNLELPVANTLVQIGITNANQLATFTASLAGRSLSEQIQYLQTLGLPLSAAQSVAQSLSQIAASLPSSLGQLTNIDQANTMYGLASDYQQPQVNLPAYTPGMPNVRPPQSPYGDYTVNPNNTQYPGNVQPNLPPPQAPGGYDMYGNPMTPVQQTPLTPQQRQQVFSRSAAQQAQDLYGQYGDMAFSN